MTVHNNVKARRNEHVYIITTSSQSVGIKTHKLPVTARKQILPRRPANT